MRMCRAPLSVRTVTDAFRAAPMRLALRFDFLDALRERIALGADDDDDALLAARTPGWVALCPLSFPLAFRSQAAGPRR